MLRVGAPRNQTWSRHGRIASARRPTTVPRRFLGGHSLDVQLGVASVSACDDPLRAPVQLIERADDDAARRQDAVARRRDRERELLRGEKARGRRDRERREREHVVPGALVLARLHECLHRRAAAAVSERRLCFDERHGADAAQLIG